MTYAAATRMGVDPRLAGRNYQYIQEHMTQPITNAAAPAAATPTPDASKDADRKAAFAAKIGAVASKHGMAAPSSAAPAPASAPAPAAPAAAPTEQPKSEQSLEGRNTDPADTKYERARRAMLRSGWKDDEFRKLPKQEAIRRGIKLERQLNRQASAVAATQATASKKDQGSPQNAAATTSSNVQAPASDGLVELFKQLGVEDDTEAQALIRQHLSPVLDESATLKAKLAEREAAGLPDSNQANRLVEVRKELSESVPDVLEDDEWRDVLDMATRIGDHPKYGDALTNDGTLRRLIGDAVSLALDIDVGERSTTASLQGAARHGVVETTGGNPASLVPPGDQVAAARAAFAARMPEIARRYAGSL